MIGVGLDLVEIDRIRRTLARTPGLVDRLFTPVEQAHARSAADPSERYAGRFAAKEAVMKALGVGLGAVGWHDIEIVRRESGAPEVRLTGRARQRADELGVGSWRISITHTAELAEAIAICV